MVWVLALGLPSTAPAQDAERILADLWRLHLQSESPAAMTGLCDQVADRLQGSPLRPVAVTLGGWYHLRAGIPATAEARFAEIIRSEVGASPVDRAGQEMARRWLTRMDREKVREALRSYYRDHVCYPETLAELLENGSATDIPRADRWGHPWSYRREPFRHIPEMKDQSYRLESPSLPGDSDLQTAVVRPYPATLPLRPRQLVSSREGRTVFFETHEGRPEKPVLTEGGRYGRWTLVYVGTRLLIFTDGDYWYVVPTPGG